YSSILCSCIHSEINCPLLSWRDGNQDKNRSEGCKRTRRAVRDDWGEVRIVTCFRSDLLGIFISPGCVLGGSAEVVDDIPSALEGRDLGSVTQLIPEISRLHGVHSNEGMKTVAMVEHNLQYQKPPQTGSLTIKGEEERWMGEEPPHIAMKNGTESEQFGTFGRANLAIVLQIHL
ncbi:hypothetical protein PENTCL1PPCAC_18961, partial [Pristionchus entomophagus]